MMESHDPSDASAQANFCSTAIPARFYAFDHKSLEDFLTVLYLIFTPEIFMHISSINLLNILRSDREDDKSFIMYR